MSIHDFHDDVIKWWQKWHLSIFLSRLIWYCQYSTKFYLKWTKNVLRYMSFHPPPVSPEFFWETFWENTSQKYSWFIKRSKLLSKTLLYIVLNIILTIVILKHNMIDNVFYWNLQITNNTIIQDNQLVHSHCFSIKFIC